MRRWCRQEAGTCTSGQVALAVITGCPVEEATQCVGHSHHATARELARALDHYGYLCPSRCVHAKDPRELPKLVLAQVHSTRSSRWHWVVVENGRIFDGIWGDAYGVVDWPRDFRITCYLAIED